MFSATTALSIKAPSLPANTFTMPKSAKYCAKRVNYITVSMARTKMCPKRHVVRSCLKSRESARMARIVFPLI